MDFRTFLAVFIESRIAYTLASTLRARCLMVARVSPGSVSK